ncbi:hypothetical protein BDV28DRAFT_148122 [Aspergillus coremiiformis]|uniref:Phytanoyl-CoA dioxygenase family protein n=1 Tax=Aspergillus coremiiformis TaxID=138285 RepID=A0A5N6Z6T7_9EURO|nr:hypothetical protein BDV28DRAFT_148122 [Aspergillus coremiiformis]
MSSIEAVPALKTFANGTPMDIVFDTLYRDGAHRGHPSRPLAILRRRIQQRAQHLREANQDRLRARGKSPAAVKAILQNETVKATIKDVLETTTPSWWGDMRNHSVSPPLLSSFFTVRVGPGSARQGLHRDDQDHHVTHTHGDPKETTKMGIITAITRENGATEVVPGSHVWDDERKPREDEVTYGEMDAGDALLVLGNTYHGAGANQTENDERAVIVSLFCKGMYRAEENQFLVVDRETVKGYPYEVQDLLGWKASAPFCGWYDLSEPSDLIREGAKTMNKDIF